MNHFFQCPDNIMLALSTNSTRRASWEAKLGFQTDKRAFSVPLTTLYADGGCVGCIDVMILRQYPPQV